MSTLNLYQSQFLILHGSRDRLTGHFQNRRHGEQKAAKIDAGRLGTKIDARVDFFCQKSGCWKILSSFLSTIVNFTYTKFIFDNPACVLKYLLSYG